MCLLDYIDFIDIGCCVQVMDVIIVGYSDFIVFLLVYLVVMGGVMFVGLYVCLDFGLENIDLFMVEYFWGILCNLIYVLCVDVL